MKNTQLRCGHCGKFIKYPTDSYILFGGPTSIEPPDEVYLCDKCTEHLFQSTIERCKGGNPVYIHWLASNAELKALKKCGYVRAGYKGDAWAVGFKRNKVPKNYEVWKD